MRYVARAFMWGVSSAGSLDYLELSRWALTRVYLFIGFALFAIGLVFLPLPIPFGIPLMSLGVVVVLNTSSTAKKVFVRWGRRYPGSVGLLRGWIRDWRRRSWRRRQAAADEPEA